MTGIASQLHLPVQSRDGASFANYWCSERNRPLVKLLQRLSEAPDGSGTCLVGPSGSGVSHLLQAVAQQATNVGRSVSYLSFEQLSGLRGDKLLESFQLPQLLVLDAVDKIAGNACWEETLFHTLNRAGSAGCTVVVGMSISPAGASILLPDLRSRLSAMLNLSLLPLDDDDKRKALSLRASVRGFDLPEPALDYLMARGSRQMHDLIGYLDALDRASLSSRRRVTLPLVREVLGKLEPEVPDE